jgi:capsular polysaccharide biosynthesis protein
MKNYLQKKYIVLIIVTVITFISSTAVISVFFINKVYLSVSTIYVVPDVEKHSEALYQNIIAKTELTKDIIQIVKNEKVYKLAYDKYEIINNSYIDFKKFKKNINIVQRPDTRILDIKIKSSNPKDAQSINNFLIDEIKYTLNDIYGTDLLDVISKPSINYKPIVPKLAIYILIAFVAGLMSGIAIVIIIEFRKTNS